MVEIILLYKQDTSEIRIWENSGKNGFRLVGTNHGGLAMLTHDKYIRNFEYWFKPHEEDKWPGFFNKLSNEFGEDNFYIIFYGTKEQQTLLDNSATDYNSKNPNAKVSIYSIYGDGQVNVLAELLNSLREEESNAKEKIRVNLQIARIFMHMEIDHESLKWFCLALDSWGGFNGKSFKKWISDYQYSEEDDYFFEDIADFCFNKNMHAQAIVNDLIELWVEEKEKREPKRIW